jgi:hypothetical protein
MLDGPAVFTNAALLGTSAWANNFRGRDHQHVPVDTDKPTFAPTAPTETTP